MDFYFYTAPHTVCTSATCLLYTYVSRFEKRYNFVQIDDFQLVYCFESAVSELHVALYVTSLAASVTEIHSLKVQNYARSTFVQLACFCL